MRAGAACRHDPQNRDKWHCPIRGEIQRPSEPPTMVDTGPTITIVVAAVASMIGAGLGTAFFLGRRGRQAVSLHNQYEPRLPDGVVRDLERCLNLSDQIAGGFKGLEALIAAQATVADLPLTDAIRELDAKSRGLTETLNRLGALASVARGSSQAAAAAVQPRDSEAELSLPGDATTTPEVDEDSSQLPRRTTAPHKLASIFEEARRFPRSSFRGAAMATIYPRHPGLQRQPVQCEVLTRDLSCGGIGIAHSEQLFPKQVIVFEAVGKLLVGEVRWCRRVDENFYVAGCRLVKANA